MANEEALSILDDDATIPIESQTEVMVSEDVVSETVVVTTTQGAHPSGKSQGNLVFLQGQGKVREFCKMVREIRKSSKVREKSGNFKIMFG